jgi:hypothetical protein
MGVYDEYKDMSELVPGVFIEPGEGFYGFLADKGYIEHIERIVKDDG